MLYTEGLRERVLRALAVVVSTVFEAFKRAWRRVTVALAIIAVGVFASPTAAFAAGAEDGDLIVPWTLDWIALLRLLVVPVLLPALVGAINRLTPGNFPAFAKRLMLALAALAQSVGVEFLAAYDHQVPYDLWGALFLGVVAYAVAELTYQGFYKAPLTSVPTVTTTSTSKSVDPAPTIASAINGPAVDASPDPTASRTSAASKK